MRGKIPGAGKGAPCGHEKGREQGNPRCYSWRGFSEIAPSWLWNKEPEQREGGRDEDRSWKGLVVFAGTLSPCGLKTQDAVRGTGRDSALLSHEVQYVQRECSEPQVGELEEGGNRVCRNCKEDMKDDSFLLRWRSWNLTKQGKELRPCLCWQPTGGPPVGHSASGPLALW